MVVPLDRRAVVKGALGIALTAVLASCTSKRDSVSTVPGGGEQVGDVTVRSVAVVGDSITAGSVAELQSGLESLGLSVLTIDAEIGRRIAVDGDVASGVQTVGDVIAHYGSPDMWVIALGTNDIDQYVNAVGYGDVITELLSVIGSRVPMAWVNTYTEGSDGRWEVFNKVVATAMSLRHDAVVVNWADVAQRDGVLSGDGIHPTDEGSVQFTDTVVGALANFLGLR